MPRKIPGKILQNLYNLDGRNRARVIAESLARVIAAIRITSVRWGYRDFWPPSFRMSRPKETRTGWSQEEDNLDAEQQNTESRYQKEDIDTKKGTWATSIPPKGRLDTKKHAPGKILQNLYNQNPPTRFCRLAGAVVFLVLKGPLGSGVLTCAETCARSHGLVPLVPTCDPSRAGSEVLQKARTETERQRDREREREIYIYICQRPHLVGTILLFKRSKSRGREEKLRQKRQKEERRKNLETWKTPTFLWGFFLANFNYKTGRKLRFLTKMCPPVGVSPIYIYRGPKLEWPLVLRLPWKVFFYHQGPLLNEL